ncbi:MAG: DUF1566 domain-containing protein [Bacteroidia bacterium]|nr:DUF1566 domain-containing protein [Bacteroidia bacterium]
MKNLYTITKFLALLAIALFCNKNAQSQNTLYSMFVGDTAILSVTNFTSGTIQWQQSTDSLIWSDIAGATSNPLTIITTASPTGKRYFRANVSDSSLCVAHIVKSSIIRHKIISNSTQVQIGDWFRGGIVFYTDGAANTAAIVAACSTRPIAASICDSLTLNGYYDWFLPAKDQLNYLYQQRSLVGGFSNDYYWSSSETNASYAWRQNFYNGGQYNSNKNSNYYVRCVKSF